MPGPATRNGTRTPPSFVERGIFGDLLVHGSLHGTVVGSEEDVGVIDELMAGIARIVGDFEELDESADIVVECFYHSAIEGVPLPLQRPFSGIGGEIDAEFFAVFFDECLAA